MTLAVLPDSCSLDSTDPSNTEVSQNTDGAGFPRAARLLSAGDYGTVFKRNKRFGDRYWTVLVHRTSESPGRLGLAIAKKRAKRAVDRNKLKRIAREAFRLHRAQLHGVELVVLNRDAAASADAASLRHSFDILLHKIEKSGAT